MRLRHVATLISAHSRALSVGRNQLYSLTSAHGTPGQPVPTNDDPSACSTSSRSTTSSPSESSHRLLPLGHHHRGFSSATSSITLWGDDEEEVVSGSAATGAGAATSSGGGPAEDGQLTPQAVVAHLDGFIIGQEDAKKAVAIAFRNRWRRHRVPDEMKESIMPKNILLIGPTGCGKTEIARRLAKLADAPFVKVEATKFTEVGYHGRDVDTIIRDLLDNSIVLVRQRLKAKAQAEIKLLVEERLLKLLVGADAQVARLDVARVQLRAGKLERSIVDVDVGSRPGGSDATSIGGGGPGGQVPTMVIDLQRMISGSGGLQRRERRRLTVEEARPVLEDAEAERMFPQEVVIKEAIKLAEQDGIVFIDEMDKIVSPRDRMWTGGDPSSEGVQRDLLPIIEGSTVSTKHGNVNTDHMLFICSGAFHSCKPSDMMAELQGRLPIRVELRALSEADFFRILTEPEFNLIKQQQMLLHTEGIDLEFTDAAVREVARLAAELNRSVQNIGARRLHTVLERICEEVSFGAPELAAAARRLGQPRGRVVVDKDVVAERLSSLMKTPDLQRYII